jgi:hypothetical protein
MPGFFEEVLRRTKDDFGRMSPEEQQRASAKLMKHSIPVWVVDFIKGLPAQEAHPEACRMLTGCAEPFEVLDKLPEDDLRWYRELSEEQQRRLLNGLEPNDLEWYDRLTVEQKREFLRLGSDLEKCWAVTK